LNGSNDQFECGVTASLLGSGATLANAGNCAAIIGVAGILLGHSAARPIFAVPVLLWPAGCYFSLRVAIDASLFHQLALAGDDAGPQLDRLLQSRGLARPKPNRTMPERTMPERTMPERTMDDRSQGALKLWKRLMAITGIQIAASLAAAIAEVWARR
jgi:hypothetical protein